MSNTVYNSKINRRSLVLGAVFLVGGAAALTRFLRGAGSAESGGPSLSAEEFALLEQVTETMIPQTDTPGAIGAGVPVFLREMLKEWASAKVRAQFVGVLTEIDKHSWSSAGAPFLELPAQRRLDVMRDFDAQAIARSDPAYGEFKFLVLCGYYHSEAGATQELRYELVPGAWRACLPLTEVGRASAV